MKRQLLAAVALAGGLSAQPAVWNIDSVHSNAQFAVRHLMVSNVRGEFAKLGGTVTWDPKDLAQTRIDVTIEAASIQTRNGKRDAHLKSPDFFDVEKFPTLTFQSRQAAQAGTGRAKVTGDLTIHGVTKQVVLDVEGPTEAIQEAGGRSRVGAAATARINRKDFGLVWNRVLDGGGVAVGDEVSITIDVELVKPKSP